METTSVPNKYTYVELVKIQKTIESMSIDVHSEFLEKLFDDGKIILNENNNGVRVNLSNVSQEIMEELETHIEYIKKRNSQLSSDETKRDNLRRDLL
jgi:hypothetical protein